MARIRVHGNRIVISGRDAEKVFQKLSTLPRIDLEKCKKEAAAMKFPEYSEKGYERLRELEKI